VQQVTLRLTEELPKPFTENDKTHEPTVLFHDDLSTRNILVDENGVVTAVLDWELASVFPLYKSCQLPKFLDGPNKCKCLPREDFDATKTER
jgi:Phosphotransferase enzyme family